MLLQILIGLAIAGVVVPFGGFDLAASILVGVALIAFNVGVLGWSWRRLLDKKSIAWTVSIIVIKYVVLLGSIYILAREQWFASIGAGVGIVSFVLVALMFAIIENRKVSGKLGSL